MYMSNIILQTSLPLINTTNLIKDFTYKISHNKLIVFNKMLEIASSGLF